MMRGLSRRGLIAAATGSLAVSRAAFAEGWARDVGLYAEPTLAPGLRAVGRDFTVRTGAGVSVLTAPPTLLLEQIQHNAAHDLLIVPPAAMDEAAQRGFIAPQTRRERWKNPLVIAIAGAAQGAPDLAAVFAAGPIAATDPTVAASFDGHAVLATLDPGHAANIIGVANTADAADMLLAGRVHSALLCLTDVRARPGLSVAIALDKTPPISLAFALNPHPPSRNAEAFFAFLDTPPIAARLRAAGLEISA